MSHLLLTVLPLKNNQGVYMKTVFKRMFVILILASFVIPSTVFAYERGSQDVFTANGEDKKLAVTEIVFRDENGNQVNSLTAGAVLRADIRVRNNGSSETDAVFYLNLYKTNRIVVSDFDEKSLLSDKDIVFETEITLPENIEGMTVSAILWNNPSDMMPLASAAVMPVRDTGLRAVTVNGIAVNDFSADVYDYEVEYNGTEIPSVCATVLDGATYVNIVKPVFFPGKSLIELYLSNGEKKEYTVKYLNDLSFVRNPSSEATPQNVPVFKTGLAEGEYCASDRTNMTYSHVSEEITGKDYFICPMSWATLSRLKKIWNGTQSGSLAMFSFELTRTALVRVICEDECVVEGSFTEENGWKKTVSETPYYTRVYNGSEYNACVMYEKEFTVPAGETLKADIPNHGGAAAYTVVVDYKY